MTPEQPVRAAGRSLRTARLSLDAVVEEDLDDHVALMSDPRVWAHLPSGRHIDPVQTAEGIRHSLGHWARDGLGYWTARLRSDLAPEQVPTGLEPGAVVGTGGCAVRVGTSWWNLYYRFTPAAWGTGLAAELVTAALDAARTVDPDRPVIASLLEHNVASRKRAERSGLSLVWRGLDAHDPDPAAVRLVYADRAIAPDLLDRITMHP